MAIKERIVCMAHTEMADTEFDRCQWNSFQPPTFAPHRLIRGGHLQTIASIRSTGQPLDPSARHTLTLPDGDAIVLHENVPVDGIGHRGAGRSPKCAVLVHGLGGCHGSPYMIRLGRRLVDSGWTVYRVDMRGAGAARELASGLNHAGRSQDIAAALEFVAERNPQASIAAVGVSLGGNQLLRLAGLWGQAGYPAYGTRLERIAVVAPPIDLVRCSENMGRPSRRIYNHYFIRALFDSAPPRLRDQPLFRELSRRGRPKTLYQLDDQLTAPLSGFDGARDYYTRCGAGAVVGDNRIATLVLAATDDPIVPADCFQCAKWPSNTRLLLTKTGGHAGFVTAGRRSWMDDCLLAWMEQF